MLETGVRVRILNGVGYSPPAEGTGTMGDWSGAEVTLAVSQTTTPVGMPPQPMGAEAQGFTVWRL